MVHRYYFDHFFKSGEKLQLLPVGEFSAILPGSLILFAKVTNLNLHFLKVLYTKDIFGATLKGKLFTIFSSN